MCEKLKDEIPRHLSRFRFRRPWAAKFIARETVKAMRKDVLAKCYGGDISRKRKLLKNRRKARRECARSETWKFRKRHLQ